MIESKSIEFKREYTDKIKYSVIAFANCDGGKIYIGIDDDGIAVGVSDIDNTINRISNLIRDSIEPDVTVFTDYELISKDKKTVILITVQRGTARPYYLKKKGVRPEGVYVRQGASSVPASQTEILKMIKDSSNDCYEDAVSLNQDLSFNSAGAVFAKRELAFGDQQKRSLGLIDASGRYTNLAFLLSDQFDQTIKFASFSGTSKTTFQHRCELSGSIFSQLESCYAELDLYNQLRSEFDAIYRHDRLNYPKEAIREALFNCLVHKDYSEKTSIQISVFEDRIEMLNYGGLIRGLTYNDLTLGISKLRNSKLANIFYRLDFIEAYGTGIPKIFEQYKQYDMRPQIATSDNGFKITLPNVNYMNPILKPSVGETITLHYNPPVDKKLQTIQELFKNQSTVSRQDIQDVLKISQASAILIIRDYVARGILEKINQGKYTRYRLVRS